MDKFLLANLSRFQLHSKLLATEPPSKNSAAWIDLHDEFDSTQEALSGGLEGLLGNVTMMELEVSYGRLGAKDLIGLTEKLRELLAKAMGLGVLYRTVESQFKVRLRSRLHAGL